MCVSLLNCLSIIFSQNVTQSIIVISRTNRDRYYLYISQDKFNYGYLSVRLSARPPVQAITWVKVYNTNEEVGITNGQNGTIAIPNW